MIKNKEILEDKIKRIPKEKGSLKSANWQWNNAMIKTIIKKIWNEKFIVINIELHNLKTLSIGYY